MYQKLFYNLKQDTISLSLNIVNSLQNLKNKHLNREQKVAQGVILGSHPIVCQKIELSFVKFLL